MIIVANAPIRPPYRFAREWTLPLNTKPPPKPVPRIKPNTTGYYWLSLSQASDKAKQFASFSARTSLPKRSDRSF